jgi:hypothetical protein
MGGLSGSEATVTGIAASRAPDRHRPPCEALV